MLVLAALIALACSSTPKTRLLRTWTPEETSEATYGRLMVVGLAGNPAARAHYENSFVDKLAGYGVVAVASINVVPELADIDRETVESWLAEFSLDGVIVTRVTTTEPPRRYVPPLVSLAGWYGTWGMASEVAPGDARFFVETGLFDARSEDLRYSAVLETEFKGDPRQTTNALALQVAAELEDRGYFPKRR